MRSLLLGCVILSQCGQGPTPEHNLKADRPFSIENMLALEPVGGLPPTAEFSKPFLILIYLTRSACESCKLRELRVLKNFQEVYGDMVDFAMISKGIHRSEFRNLRKVGLVNFPVFKASSDVDLGLPKVPFFIAFADLDQAKILLEFQPEPGDAYAGVIHDFEKAFVEILSQAP